MRDSWYWRGERDRLCRMLDGKEILKTYVGRVLGLGGGEKIAGNDRGSIER